MRYGLVQKWFVTAMILAIVTGGPGSYLCMTGQGALQVESVWSGRCMARVGICSTSAGSQMVGAAESPCGACIDISLHLDSSLPSSDRMAMRHGLVSPGTPCVCIQSMRSAMAMQALEPAFHPPRDSTPSTIRTVVLIV